MVYDLVTGPVEFRRQHPLREGHADRVGDSLAQGPGSRLDARNEAVLAVSGSLRAELTKVLQFAHRQVVASKMKERIDEHRPMTGGQHEPVAVGPSGIGGIVLQYVTVEYRPDLGAAQRHARAARPCLLERV